MLLRYKAQENKQVDDGGIILGKVKTEQIKRIGKALMARFPSKFSTNFDENKHAVSSLTEGATPRVRNQVAGYITRTYALAQDDSESENVVEEEIETSG